MSTNTETLRELIAARNIVVILQTPAQANPEVNGESLNRSLSEEGRRTATNIDEILRYTFCADLLVCSPERHVRETILIGTHGHNSPIVLHELLPCEQTERLETWTETATLEIIRALLQYRLTRCIRICADNATLVPLAKAICTSKRSYDLHLQRVFADTPHAIVIEKGVITWDISQGGGFGSLPSGASL